VLCRGDADEAAEAVLLLMFTSHSRAKALGGRLSHPHPTNFSSSLCSSPSGTAGGDGMRPPPSPLVAARSSGPRRVYWRRS